jgi:hypothetical protein
MQLAAEVVEIKHHSFGEIMVKGAKYGAFIGNLPRCQAISESDLTDPRGDFRFGTGHAF